MFGARPLVRQAVAILLAAVALSPAKAWAQDAAGARAAVDQLFLAMHMGNERMLREVFASDVRFAVITPEGDIAAQTLESFIRAVAASGGAWDEQIYDVETRIDDTLASVWAPYTFYLNGDISHCGVNSLELLRGAEGWKITQISDTRRTEGCPDPLGSR